MHYHPLTEPDKTSMLKEIGVNSIQDLLRGVPEALKNPAFDLPAALSELEIQKMLAELGKKNISSDESLSFLGAGSYEHFIPAAVSQIASRNEFYTAYTPYQPEAAQGTLQVIYEYQSMIASLTGMDVANASHYDGATSLAEAALLALRHTDRTRVLVSRAVHPHSLRVLKTYLEGTPYEIEMFGFDSDGAFNREEVMTKLNPDVAGVIFQTPNFLGVVENLEDIAESVHVAGALLILTGNPMAMSVLKSPGEWGADVAAGEAQPLGIPVQFGGPYLGYFATTRALMRRIPGRLAGLTKDSDGKRAFCLTLQAREQHIRRERANSNICTNQALCALMACVYMTLMGKSGIREVAEINLDRAYYLREKISQLKGYEVNTTLPIFNEFVVKTQKSVAMLSRKLLKEHIFPGVELGQFYPELKNHFLVCATETKSPQDLDRFVEALAKC